MKLAGFPKFALLSLAGVFTLALAGCGGSNLALTQGNWAITATSTAPVNASATAFVVGGNLTQSGSSLTGTMYVTQSLCFDPSTTIPFTGTVHEKKVTLTSTNVAEQGVINVTASGTKDSLTGTYTVTGGQCDGDQGTVAANPVPSISGTWNGSLSIATLGTKGLGVAQPTISIALTQAATASTDGTFALTGTITYANSPCSVSGTITNATVAGNFVTINATTVETDDTEGVFSYTDGVLDSTTSPKNVTGTYEVDGACSQFQTLTLTKQ
jgi:hypothetical protein